MNDTSRQGSLIQNQNVLEILSQILVSIYRWNYKPLETLSEKQSEHFNFQTQAL